MAGFTRGDIPPNGDYTHTWFKAKGTYLNRGGFPSGHTAGAFAVATIFSRRYGRWHPWVPWIAYPLAGLTGISRITDSAHFPSDVFVGDFLLTASVAMSCCVSRS